MIEGGRDASGWRRRGGAGTGPSVCFGHCGVVRSLGVEEAGTGAGVVVVVKGRQGREGEGCGEARAGGGEGEEQGIGPSACFGRCGEAGEVEEESAGRCGVWFGRRV